ncbi:oxidoreductase [Streptomyces olivochromogenes]|uniref:oxidoreductase n=1 Tax=Streptomyces olivochromogenes TaxID=1963 RepID=UPI001F1CD05F|nr:oxidoreductase [Streptomyces olivochromogenes]MCF3128944.1 oxidoreductase [Streptomyces olivochromogenes]
MSRKVALVTGASSGIGEAIARHLKEAGYTVYGAARRVDRMAALTEDGVHTLSLDVTDEASLTAAIKRVIDAEGRIDVLVNNAGYGSYGALEDVPLDEARAQIEVNVFGLARLTQLVLPHMRAQRSGTVVNISSMGGKFTTPLGAWYHASKYAVEALSDALRMETRPFGIHVTVVEPGSIQTEWGDIAADKLRHTSGGQGPYAKQAEAMAKTLEGSSRGGRMTSPPAVIARTVTKAATARRPKTRYRAGFGATPLVFLSRILPDRTFDALIKRASGVPA